MRLLKKHNTALRYLLSAEPLLLPPQ